MGAAAYGARVCGHGGNGPEASWGKVELQSDACSCSADRGVGGGESQGSVGGVGIEAC